MNRRGFLGSILAAAAAPAIVRADSLMRVVPRGLWRPTGLEVIPPLSGGYLAPAGLLAQLYDNMANCVFSRHIADYVDGQAVVWPMVTGENLVTSIALTRGGETKLIRQAIGLPLMPNGGDIVLSL